MASCTSYTTCTRQTSIFHFFARVKMRVTCPPLSGCSSRPLNSPSDFHRSKQRVRFICIADNARPVNVARPDAFRPVMLTGKALHPKFRAVLSLCLRKEFRVAARRTSLRVRLPVSLCRVQACARVRAHRANPREGKRQCATPVHSSAPRRSSRRANQPRRRFTIAL